MGYAHLVFFDQIRLELWNTPILNRFHRVGRAALSVVECPEISVPHQDVEVPTKSYRRMSNLGTFWNEIRQNIARNQTEVLTEKNVCTELLTKLSDSEKSWMEI